MANTRYSHQTVTSDPCNDYWPCSWPETRADSANCSTKFHRPTIHQIKNFIHFFQKNFKKCKCYISGRPSRSFGDAAGGVRRCRGEGQVVAQVSAQTVRNRKGDAAHRRRFHGSSTPALLRRVGQQDRHPFYGRFNYFKRGTRRKRNPFTLKPLRSGG